jgi:hypothetical protein
VDPQTGAHTQGIMNLWKNAKMRNKKHYGTARSMLHSYLSDFMWRERHRDDDMQCKDVRPLAL